MKTPLARRFGECPILFFSVRFWGDFGAGRMEKERVNSFSCTDAEPQRRKRGGGIRVGFLIVTLEKGECKVVKVI